MPLGLCPPRHNHVFLTTWVHLLLLSLYLFADNSKVQQVIFSSTNTSIGHDALLAWTHNNSLLLNAKKWTTCTFCLIMAVHTVPLWSVLWCYGQWSTSNTLGSKAYMYIAYEYNISSLQQQLLSRSSSMYRTKLVSLGLSRCFRTVNTYAALQNPVVIAHMY